MNPMKDEKNSVKVAGQSYGNWLLLANTCNVLPGEIQLFWLVKGTFILH